MKSYPFIIVVLSLSLLVSGCQTSHDQTSLEERVKIGIMLDFGLGDQAFNDAAFKGLMKARDELGIIFEYRQLNDGEESYQRGITELVEEDCDLIIGLGFNIIEDLTFVAKENPDQQFLIVDGEIDLPNVTSVTFKDEEGSYIVGAIAGLKTKTNSVGFIGGMNIPVINNFESGFIAGVNKTNPSAVVIVDYAEEFGNAKVGQEIAKGMITTKDVDIIYHAAGFTGLGVIEETANHNKFAIGVDSDQFYLAENAVITSMLKNVDVAVFTVIQSYIQKGEFTERHLQLGVKENGVGVAPIRIISLSVEEKKVIETLTQQLQNGLIKFESAGLD